MNGPWMESGNMKYAYNGIEYEDFMGLDMNMATFRGLDPALGRWCQIDPKAEATFGLTPYGSMNNNPISIVDPDGDLGFFAVVGIGALINGVGGGISASNSGGSFFGGFAKGAVVGGLTSAATFGVGAAFGPVGGLANELGRAGAHGLVGGLNSHLSGGSFGSGFLSGGISSGFGSAFNGVSGLEAYIGGGLSGGFASLAGGGNFLSGAGQGLLTTALNHQSHPDCPDCPIEVVGPQVTVRASRLTRNVGIGPTTAAAAWIGAGFTSAGNIQSGNGYWLGHNGKYYNISWGGNQYTGARSYAQYSSRALKIGGNVLGAVNYAGISQQYVSGQLGGVQYGAEMVSNTISTFGGIPGIGWGVGWETGKAITNRSWYQNWKRKSWLPWRKRNWGY